MLSEGRGRAGLGVSASLVAVTTRRRWRGAGRWRLGCWHDIRPWSCCGSGLAVAGLGTCAPAEACRRFLGLAQRLRLGENQFPSWKAGICPSCVLCAWPGPGVLEWWWEAHSSSSGTDTHFVQPFSIRLEEEAFSRPKGPSEHTPKEKEADIPKLALLHKDHRLCGGGVRGSGSGAHACCELLSQVIFLPSVPLLYIDETGRY